MTEQEFLDHHGLSRNPFADEDAQTDAVFREHCLTASYHPAWSKVYGDPRQPATAIVLGPKGSGKTAMRLQIQQQLDKFNRENPDRRVFCSLYDDFNRYLGPFLSSLPSRLASQPEKALGALQVWDHIDGLLCQTTTDLVDRLLASKDRSSTSSAMDSIQPDQLHRLDRAQRRDLILLAACYDQATTGSFFDRAKRLIRLLKFQHPATWLWFLVGCVGTIASIGIAGGLVASRSLGALNGLWVLLGLLLASWLPYACRYGVHLFQSWRLSRNIRVGRHSVRTLARVLMQVPANELAGQPLPVSQGSDSRYAMLNKLQSALRSLGFEGLIVLVDRVDEPDLINGRPERMRGLVWPLLDNKLLKHPGLGLKLLLPNDLQYFLDRETREFRERARLDKQNLVSNFEWTGEALFDVAVARMKACSMSGNGNPIQFFDEKITESRLILAMQSLRTPRNLFRFLYRLISEHCKSYRSTAPQFRIQSETFESNLALFLSELQRQEISA